MKAYFLKYFFFTALVFLLGCKDQKGSKEISLDAKSDENQHNIIRTFYNIPSPSEQLNKLRELDGKDVINKLLSPKQVYKYNTKKSQLIVFGVYAADASYLASKSETSQIMAYLATLRNLSTNLGMQNLLSDRLLKLLTKPDSPADSLFLIADKYYLGAFDQMINSNKGSDLGLILFGGWLESMYISLESSLGFNKSSKVDIFIADQKMVAENLMSYLLDYQESELITEIIDDMTKILDVYENMDCTYSKTQVTQNEQNLILEGGTKCVLTQVVFDDLQDLITTLRNDYTK